MKKFKAWVRGLVGGVIGSACSTALAGLGLAGAQAAGADVKALDFKQLGAVLVSGAVIGALLYLKQSPVPPPEDDTQQFTKD